MDWKQPPQSDAEMPLWRAFAATVELEVWQVIRSWVNKYGNPFIMQEDEDYEHATKRHLFQQAIRYVYEKE